MSDALPPRVWLVWTGDYRQDVTYVCDSFQAAQAMAAKLAESSAQADPYPVLDLAAVEAIQTVTVHRLQGRVQENGIRSGYLPLSDDSSPDPTTSSWTELDAALPIKLKDGRVLISLYQLPPGDSAWQGGTVVTVRGTDLGAALLVYEATMARLVDESNQQRGELPLEA